MKMNVKCYYDCLSLILSPINHPMEIRNCCISCFLRHFFQFLLKTHDIHAYSLQYFALSNKVYSRWEHCRATKSVSLQALSTCVRKFTFVCHSKHESLWAGRTGRMKVFTTTSNYFHSLEQEIAFFIDHTYISCHHSYKSYFTVCFDEIIYSAHANRKFVRLIEFISTWINNYRRVYIAMDVLGLQYGDLAFQTPTVAIGRTIQLIGAQNFTETVLTSVSTINHLLKIESLKCKSKVLEILWIFICCRFIEFFIV